MAAVETNHFASPSQIISIYIQNQNSTHFEGFNQFKQFLIDSDTFPYHNNTINDPYEFPIFQHQQYWIRFLICKGLVNDCISFIKTIQPPETSDMEPDQYISDFLQYNHPHFNMLSIKDFAFIWSDKIDFIQHIINISSNFQSIQYIQNLISNNSIWINHFYHIFGGIQTFTDDNNISFTRNFTFHYNMFDEITEN